MRDEAETVAVPILIMGLLAATIAMFDLNLVLFDGLNQVFRLLPDSFWANVTILGDALVVLALLNLLAPRYPQLLAAGLLAGLLAAGFTRTLKTFTAMDRPLMVLGDQMHFIGSLELHNSSFPSGHTMAAFALAGVVTLVIRNNRLSAGLFCLALLVGVSRIAVGAHWPMDVAAGAAFGWFSAWAGWKLAAHWHGATTITGQRLLAGLFLLFALMLFWLDTDYPQALGLQILIAISATLAILTYSWQIWRKSGV